MSEVEWEREVHITMKKPLICAEWTAPIPSYIGGEIMSPKFYLKSVQYQFILMGCVGGDLRLRLRVVGSHGLCNTECFRCTVLVSRFDLEPPPPPVRKRIELWIDLWCMLDPDLEKIRGKTISFLVVIEEDEGSTQEEEEADRYSDPKRFHSLPRDFAKLLDDPQTADIQLLCGNLTIPAHKTILRARSEVFEKMLRQAEERRTGCIEIPDIEPQIIKEFLRYLYTGALPEMTAEKASRLYEAGDKYNVRALVVECGSYLNREQRRSLYENNNAIGKVVAVPAPRWRYSRSESGVLELFNHGNREDSSHSYPIFHVVNSDSDVESTDSEEDEVEIIFNRMDSFESLCRDLAKLLDDPRTADIQLLCGDLTIPAHGTILSALSEVFEKMLKTDMLERHTGSIEIPDIEPQVIKEMLRYMYTGALPEMTVEKASRLYEAGDKYNVRTLLVECHSYLGRTMTKDKACDVLVLADNHGNSGLKKRAITFIAAAEIPLDPDIWREFRHEHPKLAHETEEFACELLKHRTTLN